MKLKVYNDNILHIDFPSQKELTLTMCRPQEFYECNDERLRGKVFSFYEFIDHYIDKYGYLDYFENWSGFNIPGAVLDKFFLLNTELSPKEQALRDITSEYSGKTYYVIATKKSDNLTLQHELVHAYYYLNHQYRQEVDVLIRHMRKDLKKDLMKSLRDMGYTKEVLFDEINAYMATSPYKYLCEELELQVLKEDMKPFKHLAKKFTRG